MFSVAIIYQRWNKLRITGDNLVHVLEAKSKIKGPCPVITFALIQDMVDSKGARIGQGVYL